MRPLGALLALLAALSSAALAPGCLAFQPRAPTHAPLRAGRGKCKWLGPTRGLAMGWGREVVVLPGAASRDESLIRGFAVDKNGGGGGEDGGDEAAGGGGGGEEGKDGEGGGLVERVGSFFQDPENRKDTQLYVVGWGVGGRMVCKCNYRIGAASRHLLMCMQTASRSPSWCRWPSAPSSSSRATSPPCPCTPPSWYVRPAS